MPAPRNVSIGTLVSVPGQVFATAYSALTYKNTVYISGYGYTRMCIQSGVITSGGQVSNSGAVYAYDNAGGNCDGARSLPSGWLGVTVDGYRDGAFCGTTGFGYSSSSTSGFGMQTVLCSNTSGTQTFFSVAFGKVYDGAAYRSVPGITSPSQNY